MKPPTLWDERGRGLAKGALLTLLLAGVSATAFSKPARRTPVTVTQPDGTTLTIIKQGDERAHLTFTADGILLAENADGSYCYAEALADGGMRSTGVAARDAAMRTPLQEEWLAGMRVSEATAGEMMAAIRERGEMRRGKTTRAMDENGKWEHGPGLCETTFPAYGDQKAVVILVEFQDLKFGKYNKTKYAYNKYQENGTAHEYFTDMLNKEGFDGFGGTGSCRDYFRANSTDKDGNVQFNPQFDLYGPVTLPEEMSYYGANDVYGNDKHPEQMAIHAMDILDPDVDFSQYDRDGDGIIDNVYIFYAGYGEADGGPASSVWPHSWQIVDRILYDGVKLRQYACSNETDFVLRSPDGTGTFVHEFSHVMGLPDLYETTYATGAFTPGSWSVLDYGPYNNDGRTPPNYSAYERYALGWMQPLPIRMEGEYTLSHIADTNTAYIVKTEKENEYYLAENRQQEGWDKYIPGHGMLIWHVDYVKSIFDQNAVNNTAKHQYVDLIEANGQKKLSAQAGHSFPGTGKVTEYDFISWAKESCGVTFTDIKEQDGVISFHAFNDNYDPATDRVENLVEEDGQAEYYTLQGVRVDNPTKGTILIRRTARGAEKILF